MGNGPLYKWKAHAALEHHCGECHHPLAHPRAKTSCLRNHVESCARYHPILFLSLRDHKCDYCSMIDNAEDKRHEAIAKQLRTVYESCGKVGWTIVPSDPAREANNGSSLGIEEKHIHASSDKKPSKRERKDAKNLARAASRIPIITKDEIHHVKSVIHSNDGITGHAPYEPRNTEEIKEIEKQLRDQTELNAKRNKSKLKRLAETPSNILKVDFEAEMDRISTTFHITELLKRNTKTKGMHGKELKIFKVLVDTLKQSIIDDIILAKTDELEVCMRRAGYLRFVNGKSSQSVKDRHSSIDRKTAERSTKLMKESGGTETEAEAEQEGSDSLT